MEIYKQLRCTWVPNFQKLGTTSVKNRDKVYTIELSNITTSITIENMWVIIMLCALLCRNNTRNMTESCEMPMRRMFVITPMSSGFQTKLHCRFPVWLMNLFTVSALFSTDRMPIFAGHKWKLQLLECEFLSDYRCHCGDVNFPPRSQDALIFTSQHS